MTPLEVTQLTLSLVLIAYTNHALDHMLTDVLNEGITQKLVRLGSRSSDELISQYTLDKLERIAGGSTDRSVRKQYGVMKKLEEEMSQVMQSIQEPSLSVSDIESYLEIHYPDHAQHLSLPPYWIQELAERHWKDEAEHGEWQVAGEERKSTAQNPSQTLYSFWRAATDIQYIIPQLMNEGEPPQLHPSIQELFFELGFGSDLPPIPLTQRPVDTLLDDAAVWSMSAIERATLAIKWEEEIRLQAYTNNLEQYERLRASYRDACKDYNDIRDEVSSPLYSSPCTQLIFTFARYDAAFLVK